MKLEPYIFHCTPCGKAHAGECPKPAIKAVIPGERWDKYLPDHPVPEDEVMQNWHVGYIIASSPYNRDKDRLVFEVKDDSNLDTHTILVLAADETWGYQVGKTMRVDRGSPMGKFSYRIA